MTTEEAKFTGSLRCRHCGNRAPMKVVAEHSEVKQSGDDEHGDTWDEGPYWNMLLCPACEKVSLQEGYYHEYADREGPSIVYPAEHRSIEGLPEAVDRAYKAALKVSAIDANAFAVLLGRVLDMICEDRKAEGKSLHDRFNFLAERGEIPQRLAAMGKSLRQLRNVGAHAELGELSRREVPVLDALCRAILEYVYGAPQLIGLVESRLKELKASKSTP